MAITETAVARRPDFAEVYREQLGPVWRYVRARVPEHHEAQDVTAEVFARAWRSWGRYDVGRGEVGAWLFRIAHRTVVDWIRRRSRSGRVRGDDAMARDPGPTPEEALLGTEELDLLGRALASLNDRERDALALRFAGDLQLGEIAEVLELSMSATKMTIWRAITKLRAILLGEEMAPEPVGDPVGLDRVLDTVMGRVRGTDPALDGVVAMFASAFRRDVPAKLPDRIAACTGCGKRLEKARGRPLDLEPSERAKALAWHAGISPVLAFGWPLLVPICLQCVAWTVAPMIAGVAAFLDGIFFDFGWFADDPVFKHGVMLALQPVVLVPLWFSYRRHRRALPLVVGLLGSAAIVVHLATHVSWGPWPHLFRQSVQAGVALIIVAVILNAIAMVRWLRRQRRELADAVAAGSL